MASMHTRVALAVLGVVLVVGGGSAVALAATHGNPGQLLSSFAEPTHSTAQNDQGTHVSAEGTLTAYTAPSGGAPGSATVRKPDGTTVMFAVNSATRVNGTHANTLDDLPGVVGSPVQVQGEQQGNGNPLATKITIEGSAKSVELHGTVGSVNPSGKSFVLTTASGTVTITVTSDTKFSHDNGGLGSLQTGAAVNVQGVKQLDGAVVATHIEVGGGPDATHAPHGDQTPDATEATGD